jgi:hypothetical protein
MKSVRKVLSHLSLTVLLVAGLVAGVHAELPQTRADGVTVIHLDEYNGYFAAEETLASLKAGDYEFVVTNKADKLVGFQLQELGSNKQLDMFPLEPGETRTSRVKISTAGVRYRCPINPTPWYDIDNVK